MCKVTPVVPRRRSRLRPLDERECYLRLHGRRSGEVEVVDRAPTEPPSLPPPLVDGPTDSQPALHLVISYPRGAARMSGEEVRLDLLRRMQGRPGEAA